MAKLFEIEEELKDLPPEERSKERLQREKPVLEALKLWLEEKRKCLFVFSGVTMRLVV